MTQEVEAEAAGVLLKIAVPEGEVPVGTTIAFIGEQGEAVPDVSGNGKVAAPEEPKAEEPAAGRAGARARARAAPRPWPAGRASGSRPRRSRAGSPGERGIELASIAGTGPDGRIIAEDVDRAAAARAVPGRAAGLSRPARRRASR